ncbi:hypothetical protein LTR95_014298 [Oleoguttula sp. CCFEE 5521]
MPKMPFTITPEDAECLSQSDGFTILSDHLAEHLDSRFCPDHDCNSDEETASWITARDILHALLVPVAELFDKAQYVAEVATHAKKVEDLEYAYTGEARGAFLWLSCFLEQERAWTFTQGCPTCVVSHSLDSEFTIRLLYSACLLSDVHYPFTLEGPKLPSFMFFLESLQTALSEDSLWGPDFFDRMTPKAIQTRDGIEDLIHQSLQIDAMLSAPPSPTPPSSGESSAQVSPLLLPMGNSPGMKIKRSKMARRQLRLKAEEEQWVEQMLLQAWEKLDPAAADELPSTDQRLDAIVKSLPMVSVSEVVHDK